MYGQRLNRIDKGAGDFATAADVAAEEMILDVLRAARPDDAVLGEEGGQQGAAGAARQWLVDPLCGTLNYAAGNMLVAVNVALRDGPQRWPIRSAARFSSPTGRPPGCGMTGPTTHY
jgi:myo-inositol-1(or 4)-monophosphatase